jgi:serine incorporator 1/3
VQAPNGSLFPSAVLTLYCTYLCYSALTSEPHNDPCNGLGHKLNAASASTLAIGMGLTLLAVVYSALRAGSNTELFGFGSEDGDASEQPLMEEGSVAGPDEDSKPRAGQSLDD